MHDIRHSQIPVGCPTPPPLLPLGLDKTYFNFQKDIYLGTVYLSPPNYRNVQYLIVNPLMPHLSDHCHLSFAIKANFINRDSLESSAELILTEYNRLFWNIKSKDRLKDGLKSQTVQSRLEAAVKHDSIDTTSELISETLVEACKEAGLKARCGKIKCKSQNKWCRSGMRNRKRKLAIPREENF